MNSQKYLVIQHLEGISWKVLQEYPTVIKELIKGKAGIYALYRKQKLYYVGLASNLMNRLKIHLRDRHKGEWDRFSVYLTLHNEHMKELESLLLRITFPSGNKLGGKFLNSQNLLKEIHKKIKEKDDNNRALLIGGRFVDKRRVSKLKNGKGIKGIVGINEKRTLLKAFYKGEIYRATLRKDGTIGYKGKQYLSPSGVAIKIVGRPVNGWHFWRYKSPDGSWKKLLELRK